MDKLPSSGLLLVCRLLEQHAVQHIIVGGTTVASNGYYRHSVYIAGVITEKPDTDIWYNPTYDNYYQLLKVINDLGQDITRFEEEQNPDLHTSFSSLLQDFTLDFLPKIVASIAFKEADQNKETFEIENTKIHFMSYSDLIKDKEAGARKKDLNDIEQLKKMRKRN